MNREVRRVEKWVIMIRSGGFLSALSLAFCRFLCVSGGGLSPWTGESASSSEA